MSPPIFRVSMLRLCFRTSRATRAPWRRLGPLVSALVGLTGPLAAQTPPADTAVVPVEAVVVQGVRAVTTAGGASALRVRPDSLSTPAAPTLEQVLRTLPFVGVRENSRGEAELTVRGSESRQVAVLVDGVPLTLSWDHRTDPSVIPLTGAQSILLVRGLHSVLHGPNVLGGVVEVSVAQGAPPLETPEPLHVRAGLDHVGGRGLSAQAGRRVELARGAMTVRAGVGHRGREGLPLPAAVTDSAGARRGLRTNSDLRHLDGFVAVRYHDDGGGWLAFSGSAYRARRGVAPELHVQAPRFWRYPESARALAVVSGGTGQRATALGAGDLEASLGIDVGRAELESFASGAYDRVVGTESSGDRTATLRLLGDHSLGARGTLSGAVTVAEVRHTEVIDDAAAQRYRQRLWSVAGEATLAGAGDSRVSLGVAMDGADTPESGDKPPLERLGAWGARLGASGLVLDRSLRVHAALSRRARFPSLRELYSGALGRFVPNPGLRPETLLGVEAGLTHRHAGLEVQAVAFHHRLSDAIVRTGTGDGRFRRENREQIRSTGMELLLDWTPGRVELRGDATLQHVRVLDPRLAGGDRRAEYQPAYRAGVQSRVPLPLRLRAVAAAELVGRQHCVHPELGREVAIPASQRADLGVERTWRIGRLGPVRTGLWIDNLADAAIYDQCGLPRPGRTLRFTVELG